MAPDQNRPEQTCVGSSGSSVRQRDNVSLLASLQIWQEVIDGCPTRS